MNIFAESAALLNSLDGGWLTAPAGLIVDALIKVTLVFGLAAMATLALGKASAAARHLVWALALGCALILPVLSVALPRWQLPVVTLKTAAVESPPAVEPSAPAPARRGQLNVKPETGRNHTRGTTVSDHQSTAAATPAPAAATPPLGGDAPRGNLGHWRHRCHRAAAHRPRRRAVDVASNRPRCRRTVAAPRHGARSRARHHPAAALP